jgi:hypothetical protein
MLTNNKTNKFRVLASLKPALINKAIEYRASTDLREKIGVQNNIM